MSIKNFNEIKCKVLSHSLCLTKARALLYESYITHLAWEITHDNPSNITVDHVEGYTTLVDDYDELSLWFSLEYQKDIIACARLCKEDENGLLEIERYENARQAIKPILAQKKCLNIIEFNREAVSPRYLDKDFFGLLLLKKVFQYCVAQKHTLLTTCNIPEWVALYKLISFHPLESYSFKYFDSEPLPVAVYLATPEHLQELIKNIDGCLEKIASKPLML